MDCIIYMVDDHPAILEGLRLQLSDKYPKARIECFNNSHQLCQALHRQAADLIFMDYEIDDNSALELLPVVRQISPEQKVLIYTMHDEPSIILQLIRAQVTGIIVKGDPIDCISLGAQTVLEKNEKYYSERVMKVILAHSGDMDAQKKLSYHPSQREVEIIGLLSQGLTSEEIAQSLHLSKNTIESLRKSLLLKCDARNVSHLVRIALLHGWIQ